MGLAVGIRVDSKRNAHVFSKSRQFRLEIEAQRVGVDLENCLMLICRGKNGVPIGVNRFTVGELTGGWMSDHVHVRIANGVEQTQCDLFPFLPQARMQRCDDEIHLRQNLVRVIPGCHPL